MDKWAARDEDDSDSDEEEEESEEEESEEEEAPAAAAGSVAKQPEMTREERRAAKKQAKAKDAGEEEDPYLVNANHASMKNMSIADLDAPREPTRKEREEQEKKDAKEKWWKLHEAGKTDQAKADMARLAKIRAERDAAAAKRKAEAEGAFLFSSHFARHAHGAVA
ncbi:hypothetical protein OE88DRAFT_567038 [Heliocybe sulcata]|uniref:Casein kinase substrate phosphoprotein PP28 domain-containing protein n=1 Tax=Heliocybe sulcata TaxID=5364 RepID=A0A5C3MTY6_9AGAM|nr:hypothetical protein OE88DRAFT_567038 [Heliocybe sulcata]